MGFDVQFRKPAGPVAGAYTRSRGPIDIIMGPAGSGKTVASCEKGPRLAAEYMPVCKDGWVRFKIACVRDTYRDFARTALASWYEMFPIGNPFQVSHEGGQDRPVKHRMQWEALRGRDLIKVDFMFETGAIGDHNVEQFIKGYELSAGWGNEVDLLDPRVPGLMFQRTGRYPPVKDIADSELQRVSREGREAMRKMGLTVSEGEIVLPRVFFGDMNPPDIDHPILVECGYGEHAEKKNPAYNLFHQPGGLDPAAENPVGKPRSSYELEAATQPEHIVRRMVHGLPGYAQDGKPVYPEFNQRVHVSQQNIEPTQGLGLTVGIDAGGSPAATIGQPQPNGQDRLLAELVTEPGTGPSRFGSMLIELLLQRFPGLPILGVWADPAAFMGGDTATGEFNWVMTVQGIVRMPIMPAPSNEPGIRQEAVRWGLTGMIDGLVPRYLIDPRCKKMVGGFAAHYKLTKLASAGGTDKLAVVKNEYSHPHDAEQYRVLGYRGLANVISSAARSALPGNVMSLQEQRQRREAEARPRPGDFSVWDV
ncbi:hypothetical protein PWG15_05410 [Ensifer adhaerens]|uniref:hypothetical protein n=1 Tax=Ensifer adhaerens TaxID=106592 RepID=UPI0023A95028|nr:hypothetical protein [Ensifer adhaerens]WDZ77942.1 hypothetical protein PWG15_05410 [Ensifer adhaerens]